MIGNYKNAGYSYSDSKMYLMKMNCQNIEEGITYIGGTCGEQ